MIKESLRSLAATWLAGLLVLLPLALTLAVLAWAVNLVAGLLGPSSLAGGLFAALGYPFSGNPALRYFFGTLIVVAAIWVMGGIVRSGFLTGSVRAATDRTLRRIPIVSSVYAVAERFVGLLDKQQGADLGAMSPVWCCFGGDGAAVLALAPNPEAIDIGGRSYRAVLIPTAPVPFGGALLYVPVEWLRPARIGVDALTGVYVSMGIKAPPSPKQ